MGPKVGEIRVISYVDGQVHSEGVTNHRLVVPTYSRFTSFFGTSGLRPSAAMKGEF